MAAGNEQHRQALIRTFGLRDDIMRAAQEFLKAKHRRRGVKLAEQSLLGTTSKLGVQQPRKPSESPALVRNRLRC